MHRTNLRKVGGSVMLAVPPAILEMLDIQAGAKVGLAVEDGRLVIDPKPRARYTMADLLAESDYSLPPSAEDGEWINAPAAGRELL
jgi:antitoxin ChpS